MPNQNNMITETREAWIPTSMLADFKGRVAELNKRAARLKCDPITYIVTDDKKTVRIPAEQIGGYVKPAYSYEITMVNITGTTPVIPGYQVVAKIDHDSELNTNIVMEFRDFKLPPEFRDKEGCCDHCSIKRQRNKTYVLQNEETGILNQVGSSCLKDFTGHSNPENVCNIQSFMEDSFDELSEFGSNKTAYIKVEPYLEIVAECILRYGYVSAKKAEEQCKMSTADEAIELYIDKHGVVERGKFVISKEAKELATKTSNFVKSINRNNYDSYANNIISFVENGMIKTKYYRMLASAIVFYNNEQAKLIKKESSVPKTFIGEIDQKSTFNAKLIGITISQNDFGTTHICRFNDENENNITWFASTAPSLLVDTEYRITATVKSHKMYNDEPQTVITRPKYECLVDVISTVNIENARLIAERIGEFKGKEMVKPFCNLWEKTQSSEKELLQPYLYGYGNIATYLNDNQKKDGITKTLHEFNTHQLLLLSMAIQQTGYSAYDSPEYTKKFFKNNKDIINKIETLYSKKKVKGMER